MLHTFHLGDTLYINKISTDNELLQKSIVATLIEQDFSYVSLLVKWSETAELLTPDTFLTIRFEHLTKTAYQFNSLVIEHSFLKEDITILRIPRPLKKDFMRFNHRSGMRIASDFRTTIFTLSNRTGPLFSHDVTVSNLSTNGGTCFLLKSNELTLAKLQEIIQVGSYIKVKLQLNSIVNEPFTSRYYVKGQNYYEVMCKVVRIEQNEPDTFSIAVVLNIYSSDPLYQFIEKYIYEQLERQLTKTCLSIDCPIQSLK